jgi:ATP-dependent DNA helicase RecG
MTLDELQALVHQGESSSLEFKTTTGQRSDGARALVGMLNGFGGRLLFGVMPDGTIRGQDVSDRTLELLSPEHQRIEPTVVPDVRVVDEGNRRAVIVVRVERRQLRPYEHQG